MRLSLRFRLVVGLVALLALVLAVADATAIILIRSQQLHRIDQQVSGLVPGRDAITTSRLCGILTSSTPGVQQLPTSYSITVWADQDEACRLPSTPGPLGAPDLRVLAPLSASDSQGQPRTVPDLNGGPPWRVQTFRTADGFATIGISMSDTIDALRRFQLVTLLVSLAILLVTALGARLVVQLGLRPLSRIEETAAGIAAGDLSRRVPTAPASTEVGRLSTSLNEMLGQIEQGFVERVRNEERLRRFLADASHELRTPLTTIRGYAEMYRQGLTPSHIETSVVLARIEAESVRMSSLVDDLLLLARLDATPVLQRHPVDLLSVAADVLLDTQTREPERRITLIRLTAPPWIDEAPVVSGDEARIRQVQANLVSNVLRYTPAGSPLELEVGARPDQVEFRVIDHGPGLSPTAAGRIFERFYRGDYGRTRNLGGAGLGLSIVQSLMTAHGGSVDHTETPGGGCTFRICFPRPQRELPGPSTSDPVQEDNRRTLT